MWPRSIWPCLRANRRCQPHALSLQVDGVDDLLEMVDYLQAPHVKSVCDRASGGCGRWVVAGAKRLVQSAPPGNHRRPGTGSSPHPFPSTVRPTCVRRSWRPLPSRAACMAWCRSALWSWRHVTSCRACSAVAPMAELLCCACACVCLSARRDCSPTALRVAGARWPHAWQALPSSCPRCGFKHELHHAAVQCLSCCVETTITAKPTVHAPTPSRLPTSHRACPFC